MQYDSSYMRNRGSAISNKPLNQGDFFTITPGTFWHAICFIETGLIQTGNEKNTYSFLQYRRRPQFGARAIDGFLKAKNIECEVLDTLSIVGAAVSKSVSDLYLYSTRTNLFKYLYKIGGAVSDSIKTKSIIYAWNWMYSEKLLSYINSGGYDAVICVHLFPAEAMTSLKASGKTDIPAIFVMTDYTCIPFLDETSLDGYVIPHEHLIEEFAGCGIPREKLYPFGIPVDSRFLTSSPKSAARKEVAQTLIPGIPKGHNWFLVMTGSMGFGNTHGLINEITRQTGGNTETIVVCGRNEDMLARIRKDNAGNPSVTPDRIHRQDSAADGRMRRPLHKTGRHIKHRSHTEAHSAHPHGTDTWLRDTQCGIFPLSRHVIQQHRHDTAGPYRNPPVQRHRVPQ